MPKVSRDTAVLSAIAIFSIAVLLKKVPLHHAKEDMVALELAEAN